MLPISQESYVFFLGNHPAISAAETWRVLTRAKLPIDIIAATNHYLLLQTPKTIDPAVFAHIGGSDRIGKVIATSPEPFTPAAISALLSPPSTGKIVVGISTLGMPRQTGADLAKALKKQVKAEGGRLQFIAPKQGTQLSSAQVIFNHLTTAPHKELTIILHEKNYYLVETIIVQNIQTYELRDTSRPARDARVGMLPPKLAQMMLNIATGQLPPSASQEPLTICDPFCGLGTLLQEGWLMGHRMIGSDVQAAMVQASQANVSHIAREFTIEHHLKPTIFEHDASLPFPAKLHGTCQAIVTEPFLGKPQSTIPSPAEADAYLWDLAPLYTRSLRAVHDLLASEGVVLWLLPAVRQSGGGNWRYLSDSVLDDIAAIGYRRQALIPTQLQQYFSGTKRDTLVYARPDAIIGRELTLWQKTTTDH